MDLQSTQLPYALFKLIRSFVGERYPDLKMELQSSVFDSADHVCKYMYAIPHITDQGIDWTVDSFRRVLDNPKYKRMIVGIGHIIYVRTIPILNEELLQIERCTFKFPAFRNIWTLDHFIGYICECEAHLRERHNHNMGHLYCDEIDIERIDKIAHVYPFLH